jgi:hypothetical protein
VLLLLLPPQEFGHGIAIGKLGLYTTLAHH